MCLFGNVVICLAAHRLYLLTGKGLKPLLHFVKKGAVAGVGGDLIMGRTDKKAK